MPTDSHESFDRLLVGLHDPGVQPPAADPQAEADAIRVWSERYGHRASVGSDGPPVLEASPKPPDPRRVRPAWLRLILAHRVLVGLAAVVLVAVGACVLPTSYDVPLGISIEITAATGDELPATEIAHLLRDRSDASEVDILMRQVVVGDDDPQTQLLIRLWDQDMALGEAEATLRSEFPGLADAEIVEEALEGEVETIWGRRVAHRAFRLSLSSASLDEARTRLLADLYAEGFAEEEVVVKVRDRPDGHRGIRVEIEQHVVGEGPAEGTGPGVRIIGRGHERRLEVPATEDEEAVTLELRD